MLHSAGVTSQNKSVIKFLLLWGSLALVVGTWIITRWPFFRHYYSPCVPPDFGSYISLTMEIFDGRLPKFTDRTPGYPLFLALIIGIFKSYYAVLLTQAGLCLLSACLIVFACYRLCSLSAPLAALGTAAFLLRREQITHDFSLLTESLYTSCLMLLVAALLLAHLKRASNWWLIASISVAITIYVRPAGLFLIPVVILITGWLLLVKRDKKGGLKFTLPLISLLLSLCCYNRVTSSYFGISAFGEANLVAATSWFWSWPEQISPELDEALSAPQRDLTPEQKATIDHSWDFSKLFPIYANSYNSNLYGHLYSYINRNFRKDFKLEAADSMALYHAQRDFTRALSLYSIRSHPAGYAKYVMTQLAGYFWLNSVWATGDFYNYPLPYCYKALFIDRSFGRNLNETWRARALGEYFTALPLPGFKHDKSRAEPGITLVETRSLKMERLVQSYAQPFVGDPRWGLAPLVVGFICLMLFIWQRGRADTAFIAIAICSMVPSQAVLVCMVEIALTRYSIPVEFVNYLIVGLLPAVFMAPNRSR